MRDIVLEETVYFDFTTRAFATGVPTVLAGTPVLSVLEENNATPITSGVSVSVSRASVVGLNMATVVATAANGYENGKGYSVYISTGTVDSVSVVGEKVAEFTIGASAAAQDLANGTDGLGAIKSDTATILVDTAAMQPLVAKIPLSDGTITWNSTALGSINAECDTALTDYDGPTDAEMNARTLLAASYFDPAVDAVANVTLCATTTTNTDMVGTDSAATAAELAKVPKSDGVVTWNATALASINAEADTALTDYDGPTNTEMEARTLVAASYFDPTADAVANVTLCATTTTNTDMVAEPATILTTQMTESYAADGVAPTVAQALFAIQQFLQEKGIITTTMTVNKLDGSTTAMTFTLDDATNPTSITRAT